MTALPHAVRLNSVDYGIDESKLQRQSIDPLRDGVVTSNEPNDSLFSAQAAWSRYRYSWHRGAGQVFDDLREDADPFRFSESSGLDPWTEGAVTLLPAVVRGNSLAGNKIIVAGGYVWTFDGSAVYYGTNASWNSVGAGAAVTGIATDGVYVYVASLSWVKFIDTAAIGSGVQDFATAVTTAAHGIWYAAGHLFVSTSKDLREVSADGATVSVIASSYLANFTYTTVFAAGTRIYIGGNGGGLTEIHSLTVDSGGALVEAAEAAQLPPGEALYAGIGYAGVVVLCTSEGVRLAEVGADGTLSYGARIAIGPCYDAAGQGRFVWVGAIKSGKAALARLALDEFTDTLVPAWTWDRAGTTAGSAYGVARLNNVMYYADPGGTPGIYYSPDAGGTYVAAGELYSGRVYFGTVENKTVVDIEVCFKPLVSPQAVRVIVTDENGTSLADTTTSTVGAKAATVTVNVSGVQWIAVQIQLQCSGGGSTPTLTCWRARAYPVPPASTQWIVPLLLREKVAVGINGGDEVSLNVATARAAIEALFTSRAVVTFEIGSTSSSVRVDAYRFDAENWRDAGDALQGTMTLRLVEV